MSNLLLIAICLLAGFLFSRFRLFPPQSHLALNQYVIWLAIPALALVHVPKLRLEPSALLPVLCAWIVFGFSWLIFASLGRLLQWPRKLTGALILTAGLGNTAFVGFPLIQAWFGETGLQVAVLIDQPGTFFIVSTFGVLVAAQYSGRAVRLGDMALHLLKFPPFLGFCIAILLNLTQVSIPEILYNAFSAIAQTITPVALVAVGMQVRWPGGSRHWPFLFAGLSYKLIFAPLIIALIYTYLFRLDGVPLRVCILESAMATMVTAAILASSYGLKPRFSSLMLSLSIPISLISVPLWNWLLNHFLP